VIDQEAVQHYSILLITLSLVPLFNSILISLSSPLHVGGKGSRSTVGENHKAEEDLAENYLRSVRERGLI
jgi:hypothetical protein